MTSSSPPDDGLTLYWRLHCSSCQKVKEFLTSRAVTYRSVDAEAEPGALDHLLSLGIRGVPVLVRGSEHVYAQSLADVARFCGIAPPVGPTIDDVLLTQRGTDILLAAAALVRQMPANMLDEELLGRQRTVRALAHHIFRVSELLVEATRGQDFTYERVAADLPYGMTAASPETIAAYGQAVAEKLADWGRNAHPATVRTFYGERPLAELLERTVWHSGHHARQLRALLLEQGVEVAAIFPDALLEGLPLPEQTFG